MAHNLVVTAQRPTAVTHALTGSFTSPDDTNLIIAKTTRIEIHLLTPEGLKGVSDVNIYGRIASMALIRLPRHKKDSLFVLTEKYDFCVLSYEDGELKTLAGGEAGERTLKAIDSGMIALVDPESRVIAMLLYFGFLKCIPIDESGALKESFNIRQEELGVIDTCFLHGCPKPTIAVLYSDTRDNRHVRTYEILLKDKDFGEGPWSLNNVESGASKLIPVPKPLGGVIIICEQTITYYNGPPTQKSIATPTTSIVSYGPIDQDGSRYLLGDFNGILYILFLKNQNGRVQDMTLERIGEISSPKALCYLDNGVVFVGSTFGDSLLIKLLSESNQNGGFIEVLESYPNLGPIVDFCVVDLDRQGQGQVVTCSGIQKDGSLRVVRNGVGINELAVLELAGINGIWALRRGENSKFDSTLVVSFVGQTRVLSISGEDLEETQLPGFSSSEQTLHCADVTDNQIVQITSTSVRLVDGMSSQLNSEYIPAGGQKINVGTCNGRQVLVSTGIGHLVYLEIVGKELQVKSEEQFEHEIACLNLGAAGQGKAQMGAIGFWTDVSLRTLQIPSLKTLSRHPLVGEVIPRSVLLIDFEGLNYLLCGLGDGHLLSFQVNGENGSLFDQKKINLGTQPIQLNTFRSNNSTHVFACSDRPTVIYSSNRKLLFSNVNLKEVTSMTPIHAEEFQNCLAIARKDGLSIGTIDEIQKLHIRTVPLGETPRRICYMDKSNTFALLTTASLPNGEEAVSIKLIDGVSFDVLDTVKLEANETGCSLAPLTLSKDSTQYLAVGTAFIVTGEDMPSKGRILLYTVTDAKTLRQVTENEMKGAVYSLEPFNGKALAAINSKVHLLKARETADGGLELVSECGHSSHVLALSVRARGDFIVVADLIKSISLLMYKPIGGDIEEIARDFQPNYMTAVEILEDDVFLGAENSFNLFTLRHQSDGATEEERRKLEVVGQYHLGDFINVFRKGSLVMKLPENEFSSIETFLFCTTSGAIGVVASLPEEKYHFLQAVQKNLTKVIKGVGGFRHDKWRSFQNERKEVASRNFLDGDLIESFLDLPREKMRAVVEGANGGEPLKVTLEELTKVIEELTRLH